jgi:hypothetical protein
MINNPVHIMLDLETWGTKPGCDLRSIGACVFNPMNGLIWAKVAKPLIGKATNEPFYQAVDNPIRSRDALLRRKYNLHRDPATVQWWKDQSTEEQSAFTDPIDLKDGLIAFHDWFHEMIPLEVHSAHDVRIWSHGPQFDISILAAVYDVCGLSVPWHYRAPRDTRTVFDLAGIGDHSGFMGMFNTGIQHHALDDAICQAKAVCAAFRVIRGLPVTSGASVPGEQEETTI